MSERASRQSRQDNETGESCAKATCRDWGVLQISTASSCRHHVILALYQLPTQAQISLLRREQVAFVLVRASASLSVSTLRADSVHFLCFCDYFGLFALFGWGLKEGHKFAMIQSANTLFCLLRPSEGASFATAFQLGIALEFMSSY